MGGGAAKVDFSTGSGDADFGSLNVPIGRRAGNRDRAIAGGTLIDPVPFAGQIDIMQM